MLHYVKQSLGAVVLAAAAPAAVVAATPGQPQLAMSFELTGEKGEVRGTVSTPLTDIFQNPLPADLKIDVKVYRSAYSLGQSNIQVGSFSGLEPGASATFTDLASPLWEINEQYTYTAEATAVGYSFYTGYASMTPGLDFGFDMNALTLTPGLADVEMSVVVPSKMTSGAPLEEPMTKLEFYRAVDTSNWPYRYVLLHTVENPEPGATETFTDTDPMKDTRNYYRVRALTKYGFADTNGQCYVGEDVPAAPYPVSAVQQADGVVVSWTAPDHGENWGVIDPGALWYNVYRCYGYGNDNRELIATRIPETTFTDNGEGVESPVAVRYEVESGNSRGVGRSNYSSPDYDIIVGPAYTLPFSETFDGGLTKEWLLGASDNRAEWYTATVAEYGDRPVVQVRPVQGSGLLYVDYIYNSPASGSTNTLTSYKIDMRGMENPWISFRYYAIPDNDVWISVAASAEADSFGEGNVVRIADGVEKGEWRLARFPLTGAEGQEAAYVRFTTGFYDVPSSAILDDIVILNYPSVADIKATADEENMTATIEWTLPEAGAAECFGFMGYVDGKEYGEVSSPWVYEGLEMDRVYAFQVQPLYEDVTVEPSVIAAVTVATPAVSEFTVGDYDYVVMDTLDAGETAGDEVSVAGYHGRGGLLRLPASVSYADTDYVVCGVGEEVFLGNTSIESVTLPEGYRFIHSGAFREATSLEAVSLPASMSVIGDDAFAGCTKLALISFAGEVPPSVADTAFTGISDDCKGRCPEGLEKTYTETPGLEGIDFGYRPDAGVALLERDDVEKAWFDLQGRPIEAPAPGQPHIVRLTEPDGRVTVLKRF